MGPGLLPSPEGRGDLRTIFDLLHVLCKNKAAVKASYVYKRPCFCYRLLRWACRRTCQCLALQLPPFLLLPSALLSHLLLTAMPAFQACSSHWPSSDHHLQQAPRSPTQLVAGHTTPQIISMRTFRSSISLSMAASISCSDRLGTGGPCLAGPEVVASAALSAGPDPKSVLKCASVQRSSPACMSIDH